MLRLKLYFASFMITLTLLSCGTTINIQTDYEREASFSGLESYSWNKYVPSYQESGNIGFDSEIMARRIKGMVESELDSLGYEQKLPANDSATVQSDFQISYHMLATEEVEEVRNTYPIGYRSPHHGGHGGHGRHGGHGGYGGYSSRDNTREFVQCVLMLDIWNPETGRLVWRGWARWEMGDQPDPKDVTMQLNRAVDKILKKFPPQKVTKSSS